MTATVLQFRPTVERAHCVTCGKIATQTETRAGMAYTVCDDHYNTPKAPALPVRRVSLDDTLKLMRAALKVAFPAVKFSITRSRGTGYGYVHVTWTDGPSGSKVSAITNQYEGSRFDGMTDYEDSINQEVHGECIHYGTRGISAERHTSPAFARRLLAQVLAYYKPDDAPTLIEYAGWNGKPAWKLSSDPVIQGDWISTHMHRAASDATRYTFTSTEN